jgi:hypothetical protein
MYDNVSLNSSQNEKSFKVVENIKTHFMFSNFLFPLQNSCRLWRNVVKYGRARHATGGDITQCRKKNAICVPGN